MSGAASLKHPPRFRVTRQDGPHIELASDQGFVAHLFVLEDDIIRVAMLPGPAFAMPRTWSIAAGEEDVEEEGRGRFDTSGFSKPDYTLEGGGDLIRLATRKLRMRSGPPLLSAAAI